MRRGWAGGFLPRDAPVTMMVLLPAIVEWEVGKVL